MTLMLLGAPVIIDGSAAAEPLFTLQNATMNASGLVLRNGTSQQNGGAFSLLGGSELRLHRCTVNIDVVTDSHLTRVKAGRELGDPGGRCRVRRVR